MTRHVGGGPPRLRFVAPNRNRCSGDPVTLEVDDGRTAGQAVLQARAGRDLDLVVTAAPVVLQALVEDLGRLGTIELVEGPATDLTAVDVDAEAARLVRLLASGATVSEAAQSIGVSRRTATRRLSDLRRQLGVTTTAEAVLRAIEQLDRIR